MTRRPKPKVLGDVILRSGRRKIDVFGNLPSRLNLEYKKTLRFDAGAFFKVSIFAAAAAMLVFGSVAAPDIPRAAGQSVDDERRTLEAQLSELENQISEYESQIVGYQKQGDTLKGEISRLNGKIAKLNLQIQAINLTLGELNGRIGETEKRISITEESIGVHKETLGRLVQNLYVSERASLIEVFLRNPRLSDFFNDLQGTVLLQGSLKAKIDQIADLKNALENQKEQLFLARADAESARSYQASQKKEIDGAKLEKNRLLEITKGEESKYQELLAETKQTAAEIRKRIFRLFGGGELSFEEAYDIARTAERATGVRAALILAVLDQESKLGRNVGQCSPDKAMHPTRDIPKFNQIVADLRANGEFVPEPLLVSCPIRAHGAYGGAMGPAQFIPSTWLLYQDDIAKITGNDPPSPWRNADAFVATALYLTNSLDSSSCKNYASRNKDILPYRFLLERCASAQYYAGGNWHTYRFVYGDPVVEKADQFQQDINTITS